MKWSEMNNAEIASKMLQMRHEYEAIKNQLLKGINKLNEIEAQHKKANEELTKRLK